SPPGYRFPWGSPAIAVHSETAAAEGAVSLERADHALLPHRLPRLGIDVPRDPLRDRNASPVHHGGHALPGSRSGVVRLGSARRLAPDTPPLAWSSSARRSPLFRAVRRPRLGGAAPPLP